MYSSKTIHTRYITVLCEFPSEKSNNMMSNKYFYK